MPNKTRRITFLYVIGEAGKDCWNVKIGITSSLGGRLSSLQASHHSRLVVHRAYEFVSRDDALKAEQDAHEYFEDYRMCGEWFGITPDRAILGIEEWVQP